MSDFITIAGIPVPVESGSWREVQPERGGSEFRSYSGRKRSTVRWEKRGWQFTTGEMLKSEGDTLRSVIALNVPVAIAGTIIVVTARVTVTNGTLIEAITADSNNWLYQFELSLSEI